MLLKIVEIVGLSFLYHMDIINHVAATSDLLSRGFTAARAVPGPLACPIAAALGP